MRNRPLSIPVAAIVATALAGTSAQAQQLPVSHGNHQPDQAPRDNQRISQTGTQASRGLDSHPIAAAPTRHRRESHPVHQSSAD